MSNNNQIKILKFFLLNSQQCRLITCEIMLDISHLSLLALSHCRKINKMSA